MREREREREREHATPKAARGTECSDETVQEGTRDREMIAAPASSMTAGPFPKSRPAKSLAALARGIEARGREAVRLGSRKPGPRPANAPSPAEERRSTFSTSRNALFENSELLESWSALRRHLRANSHMRFQVKHDNDRMRCPLVTTNLLRPPRRETSRWRNANSSARRYLNSLTEGAFSYNYGSVFGASG